MRTSRRVLLAVTALVAGAALVAVATVDDGGDGNGAAEATSTTKAKRGKKGRRPSTSVPTSTTTPPVTAPGSVPVEGAILDQPPGDLGLFDGCPRVNCERVTGSGGSFVVEMVETAEGGRSVQLYVEQGGRPVARTPDLAAGGDVVGVVLLGAEVDGEPVIVVDYDFDGSGAVHSFDVVAWEEGAPEPRVVAFVGGTGQDHMNQRDGLEFVGANYDDGAPTCCPTQADIRKLSHPGPGEWVIETRTVPMEEAP